MKFGSQQCSIELSVVVAFNDDSSHWHTFHQTAAATSVQINFTISTACTTKRIRDSLMECVPMGAIIFKHFHYTELYATLL